MPALTASIANMKFWLGIAALAASAQAAHVSVSGIKALLTTATGGANDQEWSITRGNKVVEPVKLENDGVFRLTFTTNTSTPTHAHLEFKDTRTDGFWTYNVPIQSSGKAKVDLKAASLPAGLKRSSGTLDVVLHLASPSDHASYSAELLTLVLPSSRLVAARPHRHSLEHKSERDPAFIKQPEIEWTFGTGEKPVAAFVSAVASLAVLSQALLLGAGVSQQPKLHAASSLSAHPPFEQYSS